MSAGPLPILDPAAPGALERQRAGRTSRQSPRQTHLLRCWGLAEGSAHYRAANRVDCEAPQVILHKSGNKVAVFERSVFEKMLHHVIPIWVLSKLQNAGDQRPHQLGLLLGCAPLDEALKDATTEFVLGGFHCRALHQLI
eukprot:CAMPEP_0115346884 /NCGR_PEP_ID=MMETSP0270-20121206/94587_1 /TAXON_ID=71861 /ORGANISM="Scrippsiella trochoidea, Strain CCMP3099" /LENGTH=139 /DNA_ID=CAMNT_0002768773 /DNA_START=80 /DNA_END=496 /DNA_ORIENTATION=-